MRRTALHAATRSEVGSSLLSLLLVLIVLGVLAAVAVSAVGGTGGNSLASGSHPNTGTSTGGSAGESQVALSASCVADFAVLSTALQVYSTLHGVTPPSGTSWIAGVQSGSTMMQSWPADPGHFAFTWNGRAIGVVPRHGASSLGTTGNPTSANGCYAPLN